MFNQAVLHKRGVLKKQTLSPAPLLLAAPVASQELK